MSKIPESFNVGGVSINVNEIDRCDGNKLGICHPCTSRIEIAKLVNKEDIVSEDSKLNTFYHELIHAILDTMGRQDLNDDEVFVTSFGSFLTEAMTTMKYK